MDAENKINFSLVSIKEEQFNVAENVAVSADDLRVLYLVETEIHPDAEYIYVRTGIRYLQQDDIICECIIGISFAIKDFHSVVAVDEENKKISFTSNVIPTFLSITYGALRGALYERVKNTPLESFPLPLISLPELENNNHFKVVKG